RTPDKPATPQALPGERNVGPMAPGSPALEAPPGQFFPAPAPSVSPGYNLARPGAPAPEWVYPPATQPPGALRFGEAPRGFFAPPGGALDGGFGLPGGAPVAITALNETTFVVAHPAPGPGGEP